MSNAKKASRKRRARARNRRRSQDNAQQVREALRWLLHPGIFEGFIFHGNTSWAPVELVVLALLWIWSDRPKLTDAFDEARTQSVQLLGKAALTTYQGLAGALETWTPRLMPQLQIQMHHLMQEIGARFLRAGPWVAIAIDGSRATTPRTVSNEQAFCAKNYGKGMTAKYRKKKTKGMRRRRNAKAKPQPQAPQIWITLMWHLGLGLPWCWKLGPSNSSERQHVMDLIVSGHFLKNTLFVGDAGFVGYEFWKLILDQGHDFLVRVGGNVRLLEGLGFDAKQRKGIVYCWPNAAMSKNWPPLVLRLVKCRLGRKRVYLLTSVLEESQLHAQEIKRLYQRRWGVELEFRALKQTFQRRTLRSRKSQRALVEMEWSLLGITVIELFALKQQLPARAAKPHQLSFAQSLRAVRTSLAYLTNRPDHIPDLTTLLAKAVTDEYQRQTSKAGRYRPNNKDKPSCGAPKVSRASVEHRKRLKQMDLQTAV
ncbi:MAG TPA: transposase [Terriglobales bacterium]